MDSLGIFHNRAYYSDYGDSLPVTGVKNLVDYFKCCGYQDSRSLDQWTHFFLWNHDFDIVWFELPNILWDLSPLVILEAICAVGMVYTIPIIVVTRV